MLLAFFMIPLMQRELDTFKDTVWNSHRIRQQNGTVLPAGVPDHIHSFPEEYGLDQCGNVSIMHNWASNYFDPSNLLTDLILM